jgi:tetratricopeptide (TPR) repeat protein
MPRMQDAYALELTTAAGDARDRYDAAVHALLGWDGEALARFGDAIAADPSLAVAHAGLGICHFLEEQFPEARAAMEAARAAVQGQSARERSHVEGMALLVGGKTADAERVMREHLARWPRDIMVTQRLFFILFWQGRFADILALTTDLMGKAGGDGFLQGLHAFALEEADRFDEALDLARGALAANPRDGWAVHAYAHTLYEMAEFARGVSDLPPAIHPCTHLGYFRRHLLWHLALMHLSEGRVARAHALSRSVFEREPSSVAGNLHDAISLLWRLELLGHDPGPARWAPFAAIAAQRLDRQGLLFHAVHLAMALAGGGDWTTAERQLEMLRARVAKDRTGLVGDVVVPLVEGVNAFAAGHYARAVERMDPLRPAIIGIGGSRAQRDIWFDTLLEASYRAGDAERAERLLADRLARRPDQYWTARAGRARSAAPARPA